jgi:acyl-CoA thioester hydrolase
MKRVFEWAIRVYIEDTDFGGVVYYANYLKFFERARTEWLRDLSIGQQSLAGDHGVVFIVTSVAVDYRAPARLDDELRLTVAVERAGRASVEFLQQAWRGETLLASGRVRVGCVDLDDLRPQAIPPEMMEKIRKWV